jgi:hypothetical protein
VGDAEGIFYVSIRWLGFRIIFAAAEKIKIRYLFFWTAADCCRRWRLLPPLLCVAGLVQ